MVAEHQRNLVAQHVAQHAAKHPGHHSQQGRYQRRHARRQCQRSPRYREQPQTQGIGHLHQSINPLVPGQPQQRRRDQGQRQHQPDILLMLHPEQRPAVEQHIAQRAAAKRSDKRDGKHPDHIHALAQRLDQAGNGEHHRSGDFDNGQQRLKTHRQHPLSRPKRPLQ